MSRRSRWWSGWARHRYAGYGVLLTAVLAGLVAVSVASYNKDLPWQASAAITLRTSDPGLELDPGSDVKLQGRIVGRVDRITTDGSTATVHLAITPSDLHLIPADVDAAIVPKTLFGEKYVDLLAPGTATGSGAQAGAAAAVAAHGHIEAGAVITQSSTAVELGAIYNRLVPLLRAVDPAHLSLLLNGLARSLDGQGERLGRIISTGDEFLARFNPHLGALQHDLVQLSTTLRGYDRAAPDLLATLDNSVRISHDLLVPDESGLQGLLDQVVATSDTTRSVLARNRGALVHLSGRATPLLALLARYSSELPCSLHGLHLLDKLGNQVTGARGPYTLLNVDLLVEGTAYAYPHDLATSPHSDANNRNLPAYVPSFAPHCPRFGTLTKQVKDAGPFTLQPVFGDPGALAPGSGGSELGPVDPLASTPTAPTDLTSPSADGSTTAPSAAVGPDRQLVDPRLADALAGLLGKHQAGVDRRLGGMLIGPLLYDGQVQVP